MRAIEDLLDQLERLDGKGYKAYKGIAGSYRDEGHVLHIDHVQGDPFAEPSRVRVVVAPETAALPEWTRSTGGRRTATADFLNRAFADVVGDVSRRRGSGRSGEVSVLRPGQEVLERTSLVVRADGEVEARFWVGLPAQGRRIMGRRAADLLGDDVPDAVDGALRFDALDEAALRRHVEVVEDARALRDQLADRGLVAFVGDGAILPRRSGVDPGPLAASDAVPFESAESLRVTLEAPNAGGVAGLGIRRGVTLIVGGGFHGKSTLLRAIERGVYDHIPGDGRERVVTTPSAVKVRAEDGRSVAGTDISGFIDGLPGGQDTRRFRSPNASGSTSQAASIVEALEVGAACLLMDEDTSATNFMIRDARMQALVAADREPITPFIDRARALADDLAVATVLVVGGAGDYFDVADTVVAMEAYRPQDVTTEARAIAERYPTHRQTGGASAWRPPAPRAPVPRSIDPSRGKKAVQIKTPTDTRLVFGREEVDLGAVEQIPEVASMRAMAQALVWAREGAVDGRRSIGDALAEVLSAIERDGLEVIARPPPAGNLAAFRIYELAALLGRLRGLRTD